MPALRTILHPTDFSRHSEYALDLAYSLARDYGAEVVLLHVIPPAVTYEEFVVRRRPDGEYDQLWRRLRGLQQPADGLSVQPRLEEGEPAPVITQVARDTAADLIVMGTHRRTGFPRLLLGSVAEKVLRTAPCPVLTLKAPAGEILEKAPAAETCAPQG